MDRDRVYMKSDEDAEGVGKVNPGFTLDDEPLAIAITSGDLNDLTLSVVSSDGDLKKRQVQEVKEKILSKPKSIRFSTAEDAPEQSEAALVLDTKTTATTTSQVISNTRTTSLISSLTKTSILPSIQSFRNYGRPSSAKPPPKTPKQKVSHVFHQYLGIILTLLTSLVMSLGSYFVKILQEQGKYSPFLTTFWRFVGVVVPAVPTLIYYEYYSSKSVLDSIYPITKKGRWKTFLLIIIRGIVGTTGFIFQYFALNYITLADTSVISFSSPIFVILFGRLCLKEECGYFNTTIALGTVIGVLIIAKPPFIFGSEELSLETMTGIGLAASSCLSNTLVYICLRFLKDVHFSVISIIFGFVGLIISIICAVVVNGFEWPQSIEHTLLFIGVATLGFLGQVGLTFALKYEQAGIVSAFRTSDVVFSFVWQAIDGVVPVWNSIVGAVIVIVCVCLLAFRKWLAGTEPDYKLRRRLWCVLK